jgi:hypothetical protein
MKKTLIGLLLFSSGAVLAQTDLQVHYDFNENRQYVTTTLEMFKPDKWGNTFFFVDFDFNGGEKNHPSLAYMEIARCLKFLDGPFSAHFEYNGGLYTYPLAGIDLYAPINNCFLVGVDYGLANADFSKTLNLKALFKNIQGKNNSPQFTAVWGLHFLNKRVSFTGFADLWWEKNTFSNDDKINPVFISEPQLWYNFTEHLSVGSEWEFATNFGGYEGLTVCPTLGVKWNF